MIKKIVTIILISFTLTGCLLDPYTNKKYGEQVVNTWFSYQDGDVDLGKLRRDIEKIHQLKNVSCSYYKKYKTNYIYKCNIEYTKQSDTIIPFAESSYLDVYAVLIPNENKTFKYKVYNSKSNDGIWETDDEL